MINKFIWHSKKPRIRLMMVEKKLQNGGVAISTIKEYYYAALLTAGADWSNMAGTEINLGLEQIGCKVTLQDWLIQDQAVRSDIAQANRIVRHLRKV